MAADDCVEVEGDLAVPAAMQPAQAYNETAPNSSGALNVSFSDVADQFCIQQQRGHNLDSAVQTFQYVLLHVIQPTVIVLGVVGNVLNLLILVSRIQLKGRATNSAMILLFGMSLNDLLVLTIQLPSFAGSSENVYYKCLVRYPLSNLCLTAIASLSATVAVDRFAAIKRVSPLQRFFTAHTRKLIGLVMAFALLFNAPRFFDFAIHACPQNYLVCKPTGVGAAWRLNLVAGFVNSIIPMFVMLTFGSIVIISFVRIRNEHKKLFSSTNFSQRERYTSSNSRISLASRMVVASITMFAMCTATSVLIIMLELASFNLRQTNWGTVLLFLNNFLTLAKSSVNFILYCSTCSMYRAAVRQLLFGRCRREDDFDDETSPANVREACRLDAKTYEMRSLATNCLSESSPI